MKTILKLMPGLILVLLASSCRGGAVTSPPPPTVAVPPGVTPVPPAPTVPPNAPPSSTLPATGSTRTTPSATITFDFDTGSPAKAAGQNTPFSQTAGGVTALFSSPSDPAAYSVQSQDTTFFKLSQFSGNYLYDNDLARSAVDIRFSQNLASITLIFATIEYHGVGEVEQSTEVKLTAYKDSAGTTPVGSATARGAFPTDLYPQGTLSFNSGGQTFNLVEIELVSQRGGATNFLVDNIVVMPSAG